MTIRPIQKLAPHEEGQYIIQRTPAGVLKMQNIEELFYVPKNATIEKINAIVQNRNDERICQLTFCIDLGNN